MSLNNKQVRVYFNLHKNMYSVQIQVEKVKNGKKTKSWQVVAHTNCVLLANVTFKVSQAGRLRVLREKKKNVHAYVVGTWVTRLPGILETVVSYNPYKMDCFYIQGSENPIYDADSAVLCLVNGNKSEIRVNG